MPVQPSRIRAFTLIELLMVVSILAVLCALGAPSFGGLIGSAHIHSAGSRLAVSFNQARFAAASRRVHMVACPSADQVSCDRTTQWHHGWIVFADANHDRSRSADEALLDVVQAQAPGVAIVSTIGRMLVDYEPSGNAGGTNLTLTACDRNAGAAAATSITISNNGRVRTSPASPDAAAACLHVAQ